MREFRFFVLFLFSLTVTTLGQGRTDYFNVESPQVHPIEVFRLAGHDYLAVCNTRDNSVEIWDTVEKPVMRRLARIRVGLEPVSIRYYAETRRLYTANFLGDSVSIIALDASTSANGLQARLERTTWVGDEPLDIAFHSTDSPAHPYTFFVTHMALDGFGWRDALTLEPIQGRELVAAKVTLGFDTDDPPDGRDDEFIDLALKEPRTALVRDGQLLLLATKGGNTAFDFDVYCESLENHGQDARATSRVTGLGSAGFNMVFDSRGRLLVVGAEALNQTLQNEDEAREAPTGFVKSTFYVVEDACGDPKIQGRDVNLTSIDPAANLEVAPRPVPRDHALSMLTDVAFFTMATTEGPGKAFFTAFGNDRVGVIEPHQDLKPEYWPIRRIEVPAVGGNPLAGPRGLAFKPANPAAAADPGARIYVLNHLDNSVVTINPRTEDLVKGAHFSLANDPRPAYLTKGQQFLYDAKLSGNGMVSCASCHVDGRTDRLPWRLSPANGEAVEIPKLLPDGVPDTHFPADKGPLVTQSLQGLLNSEVLPHNQFWVTNAPYHWRGDRATFLDFNGAFESLLGGSELSDGQMRQYEAFVNSIHYPPNPKELKNRRLSGRFEGPNGGEFPDDGSSGANRGLKFYHITNTVGPRSCAHCHALPEGSNNRITDSQNVVGQPIESAALRGLFQKEAKRDVDGSSDPKDSPYSGLEGLFHTGLIVQGTLHEFNFVASINAFNKTFFSSRICGTPGEFSFCEDLQTLNQMVHEMDWGVGPLVGCPVTVNLGNVDTAKNSPSPSPCSRACGDNAATLACMERQARLANSGLAVQAWLGGGKSGYWFDPVSGLYVEETGSHALTRTELADSLRDERDRLVFQAVPLGSERRVAAPNGKPFQPEPGDRPRQLRLLPMVANTFWNDVPRIRGNWAELDNSSLQSIFIHTVRLFQWGLIIDGEADEGFGLGTRPRHDAPRRFQVSGENLGHGSWLHLAYHSEPGAPPVDPDGPLDQVNFEVISLPLYATSFVDEESGNPVYQTAVELEPLIYYGLMLGGPVAPGVAAAYLDHEFTFPMEDPALDRPPPGEFDPEHWNYLFVAVSNGAGQIGFGGWQRLTIR